VWTIDNTTQGDHPFHLHGFRFQVLDVDGAAMPYREWKDTFSVPRKKKARIAIPFDDRAGAWMFHCHILTHAKLGMMGMLMVEE
jgi:FtsP/CotA-like multicopper oxidase with cupredoxin domain